MAGKKLVIESLLYDIQAETSPVQLHHRMSDAGRRNACGTEEFGAQPLVEIRRILDGVIKVQPAQSAKSLARQEPVDVEGERRFVIEIPKAASAALESKGDVGELLGAVADGGLDIGSRRIAQPPERRRRQVDSDLQERDSILIVPAERNLLTSSPPGHQQTQDQSGCGQPQPAGEQFENRVH